MTAIGIALAAAGVVLIFAGVRGDDPRQLFVETFSGTRGDSGGPATYKTHGNPGQTGPPSIYGPTG